MYLRLRNLLMSLLVVAIVPVFALSPVAGNGAVLADGGCPSGTHWDTITQTCRY